MTVTFCQEHDEPKEVNDETDRYECPECAAEGRYDTDKKTTDEDVSRAVKEALDEEWNAVCDRGEDTVLPESTDGGRDQPIVSVQASTDLLEIPVEEAEGRTVMFESADSTLTGTIVKAFDGPDGVRRLVIEKPSGLVKTIPLWFPTE